MNSDIWVAIIGGGAVILAAIIAGIFSLIRKGKAKRELSAIAGQDVVQAEKQVAKAQGDIYQAGEKAKQEIVHIGQVINYNSPELQQAQISPQKKVVIGKVFSALDLGYYGLHISYYMELICDSGVYSLDEMREQLTTLLMMLRNCLRGLEGVLKTDELIGKFSALDESFENTLIIISERGHDQPEDWKIVNKIVAEINGELLGVHHLLADGDLQIALQLGNLLGNWSENDYRGYGLKAELESVIREFIAFFLPEQKIPAKLEKIFSDYKEKEDFKDRPQKMKEEVKSIILKTN